MSLIVKEGLSSSSSSSSSSSQPSQSPPQLPIELWSSIFDHVVFTKPFLPSSQTGVLLLSWVCFEWRNFVISTPRFWTTIHLFNNRVETGKRERLEKLVDLCLKRSKDRKLNVILTDLRRMRTSDRHDILNLPHCFLKQSNRWETLRLEIIVGAQKTFKRFSCLKGHLDQLISFTVLYKRRKGYVPVMTRNITFLEDCTRLDTLRLITPRLLFKTKILFSQLTEVDLVPDTNCLHFPSNLIDILTIMCRCPELTRFRFVCNLSDNDSPFLPALTHPNIRLLDIYEYHTAHPILSQHRDPILNFLDLPRLTSLSITARGPWTEWNVLYYSLDHFLARSGGELQRLELHFPRQTNFLTNHFKHLRLTPKLQHLFVLVEDTHCSRDDILQGLLQGDGSFMLPDALRRLYYWKMDHNSTFAVSSTPYGKSLDSFYLQRR